MVCSRRSLAYSTLHCPLPALRATGDDEEWPAPVEPSVSRCNKVADPDIPRERRMRPWFNSFFSEKGSYLAMHLMTDVLSYSE
jgi:hypothetical protein